jgi:hypothetical protein
MRGEVDLVDHEEVRARDARPALARDLLAGGDVDDVDRDVGQLGEKVAARLSPPDSMQDESSAGNLPFIVSTAARLSEQSSRIAVCGQPPVSTPMIRSSGSAPATVSSRASSLV